MANLSAVITSPDPMCGGPSISNPTATLQFSNVTPGQGGDVRITEDGDVRFFEDGEVVIID